MVYTGGDTIDAFDANGVTNCSGTPKLCQPLWTSAPIRSQYALEYSSPAVANGILYTSGQDDKLYAFSANGTTDCSGTPTVCSPIWTATMGTTTSDSSPAVSNGVVYDESNDGELFAFDANGVTNCSGTPKTCSPLWTAALEGEPNYASPAVADGFVYAPASALQVFDGSGVTNCSGTPKTCTPLWTDEVGVMDSSPAVANGLVYIGDAGGAQGDYGVWAFDANGVTNCSGTPKTCTYVWKGATGTSVLSSPAVANGKVYAGDGLPIFTGFKFYAWALPPTTTVLVPSGGTNVSGTSSVLDASASANVTSVTYELSGGSLNDHVIATGTSTDYGWVAEWNTTSVPDGTYTLTSVASSAGGITGTSPGITIVVAN